MTALQTTDSPATAADTLRALASHADAACDACASLAGAGWESVPSSFERDRLQPLGRLPAPDSADGTGYDATLDEYHPAGTGYWSPDAPIALGWYPYNRSSAWRCVHCAGVFLRTTEYGGYYEEERVRRVTPALVVAPPR